ncbi:MAG TPA: CDP-alcohol phosphatidyltransferase family protein [Candidatus Thalassarchaeaceae archaeon]|jgi:archaetidylinositol phosphate synthase|nr:CDP-alcohol phosphatidyltransferase family protein [Candidatus Thalassarchaeaceae archaeon]|tara:strand:- start:55497 stop:56174 length:678 start_codon:yes stop_codon:yes gene_type:complete
MFEKLRERWTKIIHPVVLRLGGLDPSVLTWSSLILAIASFYLVIIAGEGTNGSLAIVGAVVIILIAGILDGLDGALARHQGVDGAYGDFLDHTIDRIVDVGLLIAIGMNSTFVEEPSSGYLAGLLTLLGSYMGTQAQSVGLDRIYGGFSRADRMVIILVSLLLAAWQAHAGIAGVDISEMHGLAEWAMLGNSELNGMTFALAISAWGGAYTFLIRFLRTRSGLLS